MATDRPTRLNPRALGVALGVLWGGGLGVLGLVSRMGWGIELRETLGDLYPGYDETNAGIAVGVVWGFVDALFGGLLLGWLYNGVDRGLWYK